MYTAMHSYSYRDRFKEPDFGPREFLADVGRLGFASVEIMTGSPGRIQKDIGTDDLAGLRELQRFGRDHGVEIHCLSTYNDFSLLDDEQRRVHIDDLIKWIRIAGELGVPNIRLLTGYYSDADRPEEQERRTLDGIAACVPAASEAGVFMALENHSTVFMSANDVVWLIEQIGSQWVTACPDPSNQLPGFHEARPNFKNFVYAGAAKMAKHATNSHLKVKGIDEDGTLLGWDIDRLLAIYRGAGYDGPITFESIVPDDLTGPLPEMKRIVDEAIARAASQQEAQA